MALVEAARYADRFEATMAKDRLDAEGLPAILFGLDISPAFAGGLFNIRLMVDDEDLAEAVLILSREGEEGSA